MKKILKPWGYEKHWALTERYVGKILFIEKGQRLSKQYHKIKDETIYVLDGVLILKIGDGKEEKTLILKQDEAFRIKPNTIHRFCAPDNSCVTLIEVSTPEIKDVVRLEDDYGR